MNRRVEGHAVIVAVMRVRDCLEVLGPEGRVADVAVVEPVRVLADEEDGAAARHAVVDEVHVREAGVVDCGVEAEAGRGGVGQEEEEGE